MSGDHTSLAAPDPWRQLRALTPAYLMTEARRRPLSGVALEDETGASET